MKNKAAALQQIMDEMDSALIAYSGGVDSSLLLKIAHDALGNRAAGVIAISPTLPQQELEDARALAHSSGWTVFEIKTREMDLPKFLENTPKRCFFCKDHRYQLLNKFAREEGYSQILDGSNADDLDDFRPGQRAAQERGVRSPLQEVGLTKTEIRSLARKNGLPNWDKPSSACLASRIPYHKPLSVELLQQVGQAENSLTGMGFKQLRVRHHGASARIEIPPDQLIQAVKQRKEIIQALQRCGYTYITLDLEGFRSGSLNKGIYTDG